MSTSSNTNDLLLNHISNNPEAKQLINKFKTATGLHAPQALVFSSNSMSVLECYLSILPAVKDLPRLKLKQITPVTAPRFPDQEQYLYDDSRALDHKGYWSALEQYKTELSNFYEKLNSGEYIRGIMVSNNSFPLIHFHKQTPVRYNPVRA